MFPLKNISINASSKQLGREPSFETMTNWTDAHDGYYCQHECTLPSQQHWHFRPSLVMVSATQLCNIYRASSYSPVTSPQCINSTHRTIWPLMSQVRCPCCCNRWTHRHTCPISYVKALCFTLKCTCVHFVISDVRTDLFRSKTKRNEINHSPRKGDTREFA